MKKLQINTPGGMLTIGADGGKAGRSLAQMARISGLSCGGGGDLTPPDTLLTFDAPGHLCTPAYGRPFCKLPDGGYAVYGDDRMPHYLSGEWPSLWRLAVLNRLQNGGDFFLIHGALFETSPGHGVICFGHCGVGKSTTVARFRASGGVCRSDDSLLCVRHKAGVTAYPLPTASYYTEHWSNDLCYSFFPGLEIDRMLFLQRGETETIETAKRGEYTAALAHSVCFHLRGFIRVMPETEQKFFVSRLLTLAFELQRSFPCLTLKANLNADIQNTMREALK